MSELEDTSLSATSGLHQQHRLITGRWRVLETTVASAAVAVSLLVFPSAILWMIAFWLACFSILVARHRPGWLPLIACLVVLAVERPDWSPWMIGLATIMMMVAGLRFFMPMFGGAKGQRFGWAAVVLVWGMWGATVLESHRATHCQRPVAWVRSQPVVCLGDSLTTGLSDEEAYPAYLQQMLRVPVVNLGRAGITTRDAIHQLPAIVEATPQLVVIELGGNDYLRGYERRAVRDNLVQIIEACRAIGADVILIEIPRGFVVDPFFGLERELARTYDLDLIPDTAIRMLVLRSPSTPLGSMLDEPYLSDDGLHPNVTGARYLANTVYQRIKRMYGPVVND